MLSIIFWVVVGVAIGWNLPQPIWAQNVQDSIVDFFKGLKKEQ